MAYEPKWHFQYQVILGYACLHSIIEPEGYKYIF